MTITEKGAEKVLDVVAEAVAAMIKNDAVLRHHLLSLIELHEEKDDQPTSWPLIERVKTEVYERYASEDDMPEPAVIGMWCKKAGGEERMMNLLHMMGQDNILEMPLGYQFKVFNSSVKRGSYQRKRWAAASHVSAGSDGENLSDLAARAREAGV